MESLRGQLGVVPQEPFLFHGTVRDNVAFSNPTATDVEVRAACDAVGIADLALILDPDVIVLGGIVAAIGNPLMGPIRRHLDAAGGSLAVVGSPPVVVAAHGDRAGLEGAMMGAEEVVS